MRPYDPENPNADANANADTTSQSEQAADPMDYTYNPSLEVADSIDSDTGINARVSVDDAVVSSTAEQDVYPASSPLPYGTRDVTPVNVAASQRPAVSAGDHNHDNTPKKDSDDEKTDETEAIRADIEQTRSQMSATIDAIQDKLNPQNIVDQAKGAVREATIRRVENMVTEVRQTAQEASSGFLDTVKENPIPAAMAAIGLGWLFFKSRGKSNGYGNYRYERGYNFAPDARYGNSGGYGGYGGGYDYERSGAPASYRYRPAGAGYDNGQQGGGPGEMVDRAQDKVGDAAGKVGDAAGKVGRTVGDAAGKVGDAVGSAAGSVGDAAGNVVGTIGDRAGDIGSGVQQGAQVAQNQLQRMLYENPLMVGAGALAIGAAIGMLLPETEPEHRLMGEAKDTVVDKAQNVAQQAIDKVSRVAEQATNTAQEAARNEGLTQ